MNSIEFIIAILATHNIEAQVCVDVGQRLTGLAIELCLHRYNNVCWFVKFCIPWKSSSSHRRRHEYIISLDTAESRWVNSASWRSGNESILDFMGRRCCLVYACGERYTRWQTLHLGVDHVLQLSNCPENVKVSAVRPGYKRLLFSVYRVFVCIPNGLIAFFITLWFSSSF